MTRILVLTGAGISAESGLATFRGDTGLWNGEPVHQVATPEGFQRDPGYVNRFYDGLRRQLSQVEPNPAHLAIAELGRTAGIELIVVTQNVDDLHERAGTTDVIHMHGELRSTVCTACGNRTRQHGDLAQQVCSRCGAQPVRPDIVWFGETPHHLPMIGEAVSMCDVFLSIGTSGNVYPAAGFVSKAKADGAHTFHVNLEQTGNPDFDEQVIGRASVTVPKLVQLFTEAVTEG